MRQVRLYLDEDAMRRSIVFGLRARNVDVLTASEAEMINRNDQEHLAAATASGRVLYTFNVADYCVLHQTWISQDRPHAESSLRRSNVTQLVKNSGGSCGLSDGFPRKPCGTGSNSYPVVLTIPAHVTLDRSPFTQSLAADPLVPPVRRFAPAAGPPCQPPARLWWSASSSPPSPAACRPFPRSDSVPPQWN